MVAVPKVSGRETSQGLGPQHAGLGCISDGPSFVGKGIDLNRSAAMRQCGDMADQPLDACLIKGRSLLEILGCGLAAALTDFGDEAGHDKIEDCHIIVPGHIWLFCVHSNIFRIRSFLEEKP